MLSRYSRSTAGLLSCRFLPSCREQSLFLTSRPHPVLIRSRHDDRKSRLDQFNEENRQYYRWRNEHKDRNSCKSVPLDVNFLGKPGEIVVLPDRKKRRRPTPKEQSKCANAVPETEEAGLPFFLEELAKEDISLDSMVVNERIEDCRSPYQPGEKLTVTDWEALRLKIQSSFMYTQLSEYITQFRKNRSEAVSGDVNSAAWRPGTSMFLETDPVFQQGTADRLASSHALARKKLIVERVLRDCWQLGIVGEIGQLDIRLPPYSLYLLLHSDHFSFEELAGMHDAKIEVTNSLGLVRITGNQYICESIRENINDATARIQEADIEYPQSDSKAKVDRIFSQEFLEWVRETYGVTFDEQSSIDPTRVFYLVENKPGADSALRTLNLAIHHKHSPSIPFSTYLAASEPANVYGVDPELNTSWFHRQKQWFRWAMSSTESKEAQKLDTPFFDKHQTRLSDQLLKLLRRTPRGASNAEGTHETISASVGKCLFMRKPQFQERILSASELGSLLLPRTFTTDVPRAESFLRPLEPWPADNSRQIHRVQLIPTAATADVFPQLDFEIEMDADKESADSFADLNVISAKAIMAEGNVDYLLPENGLDLRFTRKIHRNLLGSPSEDSPALEKESLNAVFQDIFSRSIASGDELLLPVFAGIPLPKVFLKKHLPEDTASGEDSEDFAVGEYMFQPVNDVRGLYVSHYDFRGQRLNYSFYESGPFLPQRTTDLFLDMNLERDGADQKETDAKFNEFYSTACKLAFEVDTTWRMS